MGLSAVQTSEMGAASIGFSLREVLLRKAKPGAGGCHPPPLLNGGYFDSRLGSEVSGPRNLRLGGADLRWAQL